MCRAFPPWKNNSTTINGQWGKTTFPPPNFFYLNFFNKKTKLNIASLPFQSKTKKFLRCVISFCYLSKDDY